MVNSTNINNVDWSIKQTLVNNSDCLIWACFTCSVENVSKFGTYDFKEDSPNTPCSMYGHGTIFSTNNVRINDTWIDLNTNKRAGYLPMQNQNQWKFCCLMYSLRAVGEDLDDHFDDNMNLVIQALDFVIISDSSSKIVEQVYRLVQQLRLVTLTFEDYWECLYDFEKKLILYSFENYCRCDDAKGIVNIYKLKEKLKLSQQITYNNNS